MFNTAYVVCVLIEYFILYLVGVGRGEGEKEGGEGEKEGGEGGYSYLHNSFHH